ncbi:hybrid sensor histidine kinase/response regulator [Paenibacillus sp. FSL H8-0034]|uniref:hybrid sensor histidine kinase/response regulator n=1 Tax=Paenibacillus sp. FSL H8-0034 TaxID=2954671 RepID=UPI0030F791B0
MMTKRKILLTTFTFLMILTSVRLLWITHFMTPEHPDAIQGHLNLQKWDFSKERPLTLDGQWEFYPNTLLQHDAAHMPGRSEKGGFIQVPGNWQSNFSNLPSYQGTAYGYGSYRLHIEVHPDSKLSYSIRIPNVTSASRVFVNGELLGESGYVASNKEEYVAQNIPYSVSFKADQGTIDIVIEVANYVNPLKGGITQSIKFGSSQAVDKETWFSISMQVMLVSVLLIHAIYACLLYVIGTRQKALIYFFLLVSFSILLSLLSDDRLLLLGVSLSYEWFVKLVQTSILGSAAFLLFFIRHLLPEYAELKLLRWFSNLYVVIIITLLFLPVSIIYLSGVVFLVMFLSAFLIVPVLTLRSAIKGEEDAIFLLLGATAISVNVIWACTKSRVEILQLGFYPIDFIITFFAFASFWFKRHFRITAEMMKLTGKLQKADKQKDDFLANTSHELRNPLHGILSIAQVVLENDNHAMSKKNTDNMELLISIGRRMTFLLNDLLDLTRLKEKGISLQKASYPIQAIASGVFDMLRFMKEGKPIHFINNIPDTFPHVLADENRLIQILFNLLHNAVKYTNEGSITIDSEIKAGMAHIIITDTGIGMNEETQLKIFQPYEQGVTEATSISGGIGLGLSICKQLVELHGGTLEVSSVPGSGSIFTFTLELATPSSQFENIKSSDTVASLNMLAAISIEPLVAAASEPLIARDANNAVSSGADRPHILAVDDDPVNLMILKEVLTHEAYNIVTATSAVEALTILDTQEWDLIIADVMMPQMSGYELTQTIRKRFSMSELPVLLLTARNRPEDIEFGFLAGTNDYVTKPMDTMELMSRVRALTALKKSVRDQLRIEAAYLQAQIQPHFLFNTLNSIAALSDIDTNRMHALLETFGNYLRASFNSHNLDRLVPLTHELDLVRSYLYIEKERFEERLHIVWEVDKNLSLLIPPLSIQPLIENAVRHGALMRSQGGTVRLQIIEHAMHVEISIIDNGVGMDEKTRLQILDSSSNLRAGIGVRNTDRRLKQIYGKGLHIQSEPGQGTTVTFLANK